MDRSARKTKTGRIISDKADKTRIVEVTRTYRHSLYKKVLHRRKKFYAHDEKNESRKGDWVKISETRPLSKLKRWYVVEVTRKAEI